MERRVPKGWAPDLWGKEEQGHISLSARGESVASKIMMKLTKPYLQRHGYAMI